jgi:hypothetical protein
MQNTISRAIPAGSPASPSEADLTPQEDFVTLLASLKANRRPRAPSLHLSAELRAAAARVRSRQCTRNYGSGAGAAYYTGCW